MDPTKQVEILHLSDLHFGAGHRFQPPLTADGDRGAAAGTPTLLAKLSEDLKGADPGAPVVVCITGDITTTGSYGEFKDAAAFVQGLAKAPLLGRVRGIEAIFVVPGNHDLDYSSKDRGKRWQQWNDFHNRVFGTRHSTDDPLATVSVRQLPKLGLLVLTLNSAVYVEKDSLDERRGQVDTEQLERVKTALQRIPKKKLAGNIRIALIHHHPILIPALVEGDRGYDAVANSDQLLTILHDYGFHLILHGHKHTPYVFMDDATSGFMDADDQPLVVVAGGSLGSESLPDHPRKTNCYNRITIKWHEAARQCRVRVVTRGLTLYNKKNLKPDLPSRWGWETLKEVDRVFRGERLPEPISTSHERLGAPSREDAAEILRGGQYQHTRGNMPVVEIRPSLTNLQAYEALFWILPHSGPHPVEAPEEVTWSAGPLFDSFRVRRQDSATFAGSYDFWGPMLIQAQMRFADGKVAYGYVYARLPQDHQEGRGSKKGKR